MGKLFRKISYAIEDALIDLLNVGIRLKYVIALLILFTGGAVALTYSKMLTNVGGKTDYGEAMGYIELKNIVNQNFIEQVDSASMKDSASAAVVNGLGDKWSYYMTPDEYTSYQLYASNDYSDIGMSIIKYGEAGFQIVSVTQGTAAANAGLTAGMIITAVDGEDVRQCDIDDVRKMIRSHLNTSFILTVDGRDTYTVDPSVMYRSSVSYRLEKTQAGYVKIENFEAGTGDDSIAAIEDLLSQGAVALCIDLRNNPGGLDNEAALLLDYLLPSGELFSIVDREGRKTTTYSNAMSLQLPMVVLINDQTFAEAEMVAAVLQEYSWASILGEATSGMTRMQETFELSDSSAVRLSTKTYLTANGVDISKTGGVIPETIIHNSDPTTVGTTEGTLGDSDGSASSSDDEQLMAALKYLS